MPIQEPIVGIPGFEAFEITGTKQVVTTMCKLRDKPTCPGCKSVGPHRRKDLVKRRIRHVSIGTRAHWLVVHVPKWRCRCGRYFRQRVPGVLPYQRASEQLAKAGREKQLDAAALAWVQVTMTCVNCHQHARGVKVTGVDDLRSETLFAAAAAKERP